MDSDEAAALHDTTLIGERGVPLAGPGTPLIGEFAVAELAVVLGLSTESCRRLVGDALELRHRLPQTWVRVLDGSVPAFKARAVAQRTRELSPEAACWVDGQVAPAADRVSYRQLDSLVEQALVTFDPAVAEAKAAARAERYRVDVDTRPILTESTGAAAGYATIEAMLDVADAADVEQAVSAIAHDLLQDGDKAAWSLDRRRAAALGVLAREHTGGAGDAAGTARVLHLYAHVDPNGLASVENFQSLVTLDQITEWATTSHTVVKPVQVIDLNQTVARDGYEPSDRQHEQVALISETCVFPYCTRPARGCDTDHIKAYDAGGATATFNLAKLCRYHHRVKTHAGWTYEPIRPGEYLWRSPLGFTFVRHRGGGTTDSTDDRDTG